MTNEELIPVYRVVNNMRFVKNLLLDETLTFEANGCLWQVLYAPFSYLEDKRGNPEPPYVLQKNGFTVSKFYSPERIMLIVYEEITKKV